MQQAKEESNASNDCQAISVKLIPFWPNSPHTWFIQAEAQFKISSVSSESSRYYHVLAALPQEIIESIIDFVQSPPEKDLYTSIKNLLIERHSLSVEKRIEKLISNEDIGDRKPSDFYRSLKQLAGSSNTIGDPLIRKLWLRRLPHAINIALIPQADKEINDVILLADKIWEATQLPNVSQVASTSFSDPFTMFNQELNEIKGMLNRLNLQDQWSNNFNHHSRSMNQDQRSRNYSRNAHSGNRFNYRSHNRSHNRSLSRHKSNSNNCWYHRKFGMQARKCVTPCSFNIPNNSINSKN